MSRGPDLVLFTAGFPYDGYESVLAWELEVLAARFDRLYVFPSRIGTAQRALPSNAIVVDLGWSSGWSRAAKLRALRSRAALRVVGRTLRRTADWRSYGSGARAYLDILAQNLLKAKSLDAWVTENRVQDAIFYDYWLENSTLAIALLRANGSIRCAISRAHGFDVYDSRWPELGRVPFRDYKAQNLDSIFAISENGAGYLRSRLDDQRGKVRLARLGVPVGETYAGDPAEPPLLVSCAALRAHKRIDRIPAVLARCERPLHWVHFGDGPERERVEAAAMSLPSAVTWELRGQVENSAVLDYYETHAVSAFLSVSSAEGIPVSMMEAQSHGVPIVALDAGGIGEIVTEQTGRLLPCDASDLTIARAVGEALEPGRFERDQIISAFLARFDARSNYAVFAREVLSVWESAGDRAAPTASS